MPNPNQRLPYDGTYATPPTWICKTCRQTPAQKPLHVCSRCRSVRYCSQACQRADYAHHRRLCKRLKALTSQLSRQTRQLKAARPAVRTPRPTRTTYNMFRIASGHFGHLANTRHYIALRLRLADALDRLAESYPVQPLLARVLHHRLEILRLSALDNAALRHVVPFALLALNRDHDCVAFVKHWLRRNSLGLHVAYMHRRSTTGQWLYDPAHPAEDVFDVVRMGYRYADVPFVMAMLIVKLRIVAVLHSLDDVFQVFAATRLGKRLGPLILHVKNNFMPAAAAQLTTYETHVSRYVTVLMMRNPSVLPALLNPLPLLSQNRPVAIVEGKPSEAWLVVRNCHRLFSAIPGARARLEKMFGKYPLYDYVISHESPLESVPPPPPKALSIRKKPPVSQPLHGTRVARRVK